MFWAQDILEYCSTFIAGSSLNNSLPSRPCTENSIQFVKQKKKNQKSYSGGGVWRKGVGGGPHMHTKMFLRNSVKTKRPEEQIAKQAGMSPTELAVIQTDA